MCDDSLWIDNRPFASSMLASDDYDPDKARKKNDPWVKVKKAT
jgi:hypothetical protein